MDLNNCLINLINSYGEYPTLVEKVIAGFYNMGDINKYIINDKKSLSIPFDHYDDRAFLLAYACKENHHDIISYLYKPYIYEQVDKKLRSGVVYKSKPIKTPVSGIRDFSAAIYMAALIKSDYLELFCKPHQDNVKPLFVAAIDSGDLNEAIRLYRPYIANLYSINILKKGGKILNYFLPKIAPYSLNRAAVYVWREDLFNRSVRINFTKELEDNVDDISVAKKVIEKGGIVNMKALHKAVCNNNTELFIFYLSIASNIDKNDVYRYISYWRTKYINLFDQFIPFTPKELNYLADYAIKSQIIPLINFCLEKGCRKIEQYLEKKNIPILFWKNKPYISKL